MNLLKKSFLTLAIFSLTLLSGCDQVRQQVADMINPPSPVEMSRRVDELVRANKYEQAISTGEQYLNKNKDPERLVIDAVTNAYVTSGDTAGAVRHMQRSVRNAEVTEQTSVNTTSQNNSTSVNNASVTSTSQNTVLRAGDAIVVIPNK